MITATQEQITSLEKFANVVARVPIVTDGDSAERIWLMSALANRRTDLRDKMTKCERAIYMIDENERSANLGVLFIDGEKMQ